MLIKSGRTNIKYLLILVILAAIVGGGSLYYYSNLPEYGFLLLKFPPKLEKKVEDETANWKIYNGQEIMGFSFNIPQGWTVNFKKEPPFDDVPYLSRIWFDFAPPGWIPSEYAYNWMGWGCLYIDIHDPQKDIDQWITEYLPEYKDGLAISKEDSIMSKPVFCLDKGEKWNEEKHGVMWVPRHIVLSVEHSYSYGFSQDGESNFAQTIKEKIFPNISIK